MSNYIVSARKYRPNTFDDVVGQQALTQTLCNAIVSGKLAHAYLFCGPRGVGKTTCARIFAKTINCQHRLPSGEACNECESCRAFDEGRSLNIHELDAASNNSVENIRDLIEQVRIPPQTGKYKVFIIDEVHMLSSGAFNAFLKTLEEPPSYVIFILATTEKHKIIPTILSRCQIYDFKRIEIDDIVAQLKKIADSEGLQYEDEALRVIAEKADGGMRDALSTFDQEVIFTNGNLTYDQVIRNLNILDYDYFFSLTDLFLKRDMSKTLLTLDEIIGKGFDGGIFIEGLAKHMRNLLVCMDAATVPLLSVSRRVAERYRDQASRCKIKFVYKALKLCNDCDLNYRTSRNKRLLVEITLIEIVQAAQECEAPASDDPLPASRRATRYKQLKSIFKETQPTPAQQQPSQPQVQTTQVQASAAQSQTPATQQQSSATQAQLSATQPQVSPAQPQPSATPATNVAGSAAAGASVTASSASVASSTNAAPHAPARPAETNAPHEHKKVRVISVASIHGMQLQSAKAETPKPATAPKAEEPVANTGTVIGFDLYDEAAFNVAWLSFADSLPKEESDIAGRLRGMHPDLTPDCGVIMKVDNQQVEKFMRPMVARLEEYLRRKLNNRNLRVILEVAETEEYVPVTNPSETFKSMMQMNPALAKMNDIFKLEII